MHAEEIEQRIVNQIVDAVIEVEGSECDFTVTVISDRFSDLQPMKRQQMVLSAVSDLLSSGALHALTVKPYTHAEWNSRSAGLVQISL